MVDEKEVPEQDLQAEFQELETAFEPETSETDPTLDEPAAEPPKADEPPAEPAQDGSEPAPEPTVPEAPAPPAAPDEAELKAYLDATVTFVDKDGSTKKTTRRELIKAGDYDRALQTANQFPHIQRDRLELKRQLEQVQVQLEALKAGQPAQPAGQPGVQPAAQDALGVSEDYVKLRGYVKENLVPRAVKSGYISETFAEVEPELAADLVIARVRQDEMALGLAKVTEFVNEVTTQIQRTKLRSDVDSVIDSVVREHGLPEATAEDKTGLIRYLAEELGNPGVDKLLNKDFIREQLFAYTLRKNPALAQELLRRRSLNRADTRPAAGSTGRAASGKPQDEFAEMDQELRAAGLL